MRSKGSHLFPVPQSCAAPVKYSFVFVFFRDESPRPYQSAVLREQQVRRVEGQPIGRPSKFL
jgi:hypothetical protein